MFIDIELEESSKISAIVAPVIFGVDSINFPKSTITLFADIGILSSARLSSKTLIPWSSGTSETTLTFKSFSSKALATLLVLRLWKSSMPFLSPAPANAPTAAVAYVCALSYSSF